MDDDGDQIMDEIIDSSSKRPQLSTNIGEPSKKPRLLPLKWISKDDPVTQITTLLKAIDFKSIEPITYGTPEELKEYEEGMKELVENRVIINESGEKTGRYEDVYIDEIRIRGFKSGPSPFNAGPVLQIISVSILKQNDNHEVDPDWEDIGMYGHISVTDYLKNIYYIYNCPEDCPEHVCKERNLFIQGCPVAPLFVQGCPVAPVMRPKVKFCLTDVDDNVKIFNEDKDYYLKDTLDYEKVESQDFVGEDGYVARVVFDRTPLAVVVRLHFFLRYKPQSYEGRPTFNIRGKIKVNNIVVWESSEGQDMDCGEILAFDQSRFVFAAPVETLIRVDMSMISGNMEFQEIYEFLPKYTFTHYQTRYFLPCKDEDYKFILDMYPSDHDDFFGAMCGGYLDMKWNPDVRQKFLLPKSSDVALVEVFSVILESGLSSKPPPPLCGQIVVQDQQGRVYVFARNKDCPDNCSSNKQRFKSILSLAWPDRWVLEKDFSMHLKLKDSGDNRVCKGFLTWQPSGDNRFDRRLCDVIQGENGYFAAVHYSVFLNGKKAQVSVKCSKDGDQYRFVYGSIYGQYDNYDDYNSTYSKECYRIVIFKRSEEDCVKVESGSDIPLAKSHVSTPSDCKSLSVHVDLWFSQSYQPATGKLVFKTDCSGTPQIQTCGDGLGRVTVEVNRYHFVT